jgi:hypothetical protein
MLEIPAPNKMLHKNITTNVRTITLITLVWSFAKSVYPTPYTNDAKKPIIRKRPGTMNRLVLVGSDAVFLFDENIDKLAIVYRSANNPVVETSILFKIVELKYCCIKPPGSIM